MYTADVISTVKTMSVGEVPVREYYLQLGAPNLFDYQFTFGPFTTPNINCDVSEVIRKFDNYIGYCIYTDDALRINGRMIPLDELIAGGARG